MRTRGLVFDKYEGLGNDFLVVARETREGNVEPLAPALALALCDRHRGVGADGVLELHLPFDHTKEHLFKSMEPDSRPRMIVHNADGTVPEMCGNGLRCVAWALVRSHGFPRGAPFVVETDAGPRSCEVLVHNDASDSNVARVVADVGAATVLGARDVTVHGRTFALHEATTGNPHAVHFGALSDEEIERFGPALATHPSFPNGVNVGFARLGEDGGIDLVVWERGVGRTLACGTGASAAAAIACARGLVDTTKPVRVRLPGGPLSLVVAPDSVQMTGPARFVFQGTWQGDASDGDRMRSA